MKFTLRILTLLLLLSLGTVHAQHAQTEKAKLKPSFDYSMALLSHMIWTAKVFQNDCASRVSPHHVEKSLTPWFQSYQPFIDQIMRIGQQHQFTNGESWENTWKFLEDQARKDVYNRFFPPDDEHCYSAFIVFKDGTYDLAQFPVHLQVLGLDLPKELTHPDPKKLYKMDRGILYNIIFRAEVMRTTCASELGSRKLSDIHAWFKRNQPLIDKIRKRGVPL